MRQIRSDSTGLVACSFFFGKFCFDDWQKRNLSCCDCNGIEWIPPWRRPKLLESWIQAEPREEISRNFDKVYFFVVLLLVFWMVVWKNWDWRWMHRCAIVDKVIGWRKMILFCFSIFFLSPCLVFKRVCELLSLTMTARAQLRAFRLFYPNIKVRFLSSLFHMYFISSFVW